MSFKEGGGRGETGMVQSFFKKGTSIDSDRVAL